MSLPLEIRVSAVAALVEHLSSRDPNVVYETLAAALIGFCLAGDHSIEALEGIRRLVDQALENARAAVPS